jgi:hypothetical protein
MGSLAIRQVLRSRPIRPEWSRPDWSSRCRRLLGIALLGLVLAWPAGGYIPESSRVVSAVAKQNKVSGRAKALQLEVSLSIGEHNELGRGILVSHPTGLARLELRGAGGLVERHLLQGTEHTASRGGVRLDSPRAFLPPLFLTQTDSALGLRAGLFELGAVVEAIGLDPCGDGDCYVIGDPARVPPPPAPMPPRPPRKLQPGEEGVAVEESKPLEPLSPVFDPSLARGPFATIWVDTVSFDIKRIESRLGVNVWFGPLKNFGRIRAPAWVRIDEPGRSPVRFEILNVSAVDAPAAAFTQSWLDGPVPPPGVLLGSPGPELPSAPQSVPRRTPSMGTL